MNIINEDTSSWNPKYDNITRIFSVLYIFGTLSFFFLQPSPLWIGYVFPILNIALILFTIKRKNKKLHNQIIEFSEYKRQERIKSRTIDKNTNVVNEKFLKLLKELKRYEIINDDVPLENQSFRIGQNTGISLRLTHPDIYYLYNLFWNNILKISLKDFCNLFFSKR